MPGDKIEDKIGTSGTPLGIRLKSSVFVPFGMGVVFEGNNGDYYSLQLGYDEDNNPILKTVPVSI